MKVIAKHAFLHDAHQPQRGEEIEVSESLARELEKRGLVKMSPTPSNKMASEPKNKAKAK